MLPGTSPCGRTNLRIKGWMGRADQTTKVRGMFVTPGAGRRDRAAPSGDRCARGSSSTVEAGNDRMTLHVEVRERRAALADAIVASIRDVTKLRGEVSSSRPASCRTTAR